MTTTKKYETLRRRVNAILYPDGVPLEFGTHIKVALTDGGGTDATVLGVDGDVVHWTWAPFGKNDMWSGTELISRIKVIGQPLTLQMLLRAISKSGKKNYYMLSMDGYLMKYSFPETEDVAVKFDLTRSVAEQDEAVLDFLLEIIK
jgi:hypothetical protein